MKYYLMGRPANERGQKWEQYLISAEDEDQARNIACAQVAKLENPLGFDLHLIGEVPSWPHSKTRLGGRPGCHLLTFVGGEITTGGNGDPVKTGWVERTVRVITKDIPA